MNRLNLHLLINERAWSSDNTLDFLYFSVVFYTRYTQIFL